MGIKKKFYVGDEVTVTNPNPKRCRFRNLNGKVTDVKWLSKYKVYKYIVDFKVTTSGSFFKNEIDFLLSREYDREY